jgi:hypothetical protein
MISRSLLLHRHSRDPWPASSVGLVQQGRDVILREMALGPPRTPKPPLPFHSRNRDPPAASCPHTHTQTHPACLRDGGKSAGVGKSRGRPFRVRGEEGVCLPTIHHITYISEDHSTVHITVQYTVISKSIRPDRAIWTIASSLSGLVTSHGPELNHQDSMYFSPVVDDHLQPLR